MVVVIQADSTFGHYWLGTLCLLFLLLAIVVIVTLLQLLPLQDAQPHRLFHKVHGSHGHVVGFGTMQMKGVALMTNGTIPISILGTATATATTVALETGTTDGMRTRLGHDGIVFQAYGTVATSTYYMR